MFVTNFWPKVVPKWEILLKKNTETDLIVDSYIMTFKQITNTPILK